jgi:hypothetical protein
MKTTDLTDCGITIYRTSQYDSYEQATKLGGAYILTVTYGYTATIDSIYNCIITSECMEHDSSRKDLRAVIWVNGKRLEECFLADAEDSINSYLKSIQ